MSSENYNVSKKFFCLNIPILKVKRWFLSIPLKHWSSPNILGSIRIMIVFSFLFFSKFLFLFVRLFPLNSNRIFFVYVWHHINWLTVADVLIIIWLVCIFFLFWFSFQFLPCFLVTLELCPNRRHSYTIKKNDEN